MIDKSLGPLTPTVINLFNVIKMDTTKYTVAWNGGDKFQVARPTHNQCVVDISTCRRWELTGMLLGYLSL